MRAAKDMKRFGVEDRPSECQYLFPSVGIGPYPLVVDNNLPGAVVQRKELDHPCNVGNAPTERISGPVRADHDVLPHVVPLSRMPGPETIATACALVIMTQVWSNGNAPCI